MAEAGTGGPPLISELYRCINVFPPCLGGRPGTGGPPLISKLHRHIKVVPPCMGGGPGTGGPPLISFPLWQIKIPPPLVGRGPGIGGPPLISVNPRPKNRNRFLFLTQLVAVAGGVLIFGGGSYCV